MSKQSCNTKVLLTVSLIVVMIGAMLLSGCGNTDATPEENDEVPVQESVEAEVNFEEETDDEEEEAATVDFDFSDAVADTDTAEDSPAALGQWVCTTRYSATDHTYHTVYVRVTDTIRQEEDENAIQSAVDEQNAFSSEYNQIDLDDYTLPADVEWCLLTYEVYFPEDFPEADYGGFASADMSFYSCNIGGGGFPSADGASTYIGMGTNALNLEPGVDTYEAGNTYTFHTLYEMVTGYEDYVLYFTTRPEGAGLEEEGDEDFDVYFSHS